jgi:hypothetical protein
MKEAAQGNHSGNRLIVALVAVLVLLLTSFYILREFAPGDQLVFWVKLALGGVAAVWAALVSMAAATGQRDRFTKRLTYGLRQTLNRKWVVGLSLVLCALAQLVVSYRLLGFRSVAIASAVAVDVLLNDRAGDVRKIGAIPGGSCDRVDVSTLQLPIGDHTLVFRSRRTGEPIAATRLDVPAIWQGAVPSVPCVEEDNDAAVLE